MKVLIVEDEVLIAMHLEMLVTQLGHEVCAIALCADDVVAHAGLHRPDVALMDIHLARGSSGIAAACKMHDLYRIRCIFLSGNLDEAAQTTVHSCDPVDILGKPVLAVTLQRALKKAQVHARL
jgi:DNA-binding NarL/FixJ family response regulator